MQSTFLPPNSKTLKRFLFVFFALINVSLVFYFKSDIRKFFRQRSDAVFNQEKLAKSFETSLVVDVPETILQIFSKPFTYLGSGTQSIAFEDSSKTHVLKIFLLHDLKGPKKIPQFSVRKIFSSHRDEKKRLRMNRKIRSLWKSLIAYDGVYVHHPEIAGLEAAHLSKSDFSMPVVTVIDSSGKSLILDLRDYFFVIQKKATLVLPLLQGKTHEDQKRLLDAMNSFLVHRARLGYIDHEKELQMHMNYGFIGDVAIQIDVGSLTRDHSPALIENEEKKLQEKFHLWKKTHSLSN